MKNYPQILYKYRDINDSTQQKILTDHEIYFSAPKDFNDPFDCNIPPNYSNPTKEELRQMVLVFLNAEKLPITKESIDDATIMIKSKLEEKERHEYKDIEFRKRMNLKFGIYSMALECDNILLWSHYSNKHKGICIGLDVKLLSKQLNDQKYANKICKVNYTFEYPFFPPSIFSEGQFINLFITKSKLWEYENEYRIVSFRADSKEFGERVFKIEYDIIKSIYFGCEMSEDKMIEISSMLGEKLKNIDLYKMEKSEKEFKVIAKKYSL